MTSKHTAAIILSMSLLFMMVAPTWTMAAEGSTIAALSPNISSNDTMVIQNSTMATANNSAYQTPTLSQIQSFNDAREENAALMEDLAEAINCNNDTLCELVFAGVGVIRLDFSADPQEDNFKLDFLGLTEVRELIGEQEVTIETPTPEPESEEGLVREESEDSEEQESDDGDSNDNNNGNSSEDGQGIVGGDSFFNGGGSGGDTSNDNGNEGVQQDPEPEETPPTDTAYRICLPDGGGPPPSCHLPPSNISYPNLSPWPSPEPTDNCFKMLLSPEQYDKYCSGDDGFFD